MRISDWVSDVCPSDLLARPVVDDGVAEAVGLGLLVRRPRGDPGLPRGGQRLVARVGQQLVHRLQQRLGRAQRVPIGGMGDIGVGRERSEEHTSELQSLMRISYAVFCLKKKKQITIKDVET